MTLDGRDTPPSNQDGPFGYEPESVSTLSAPGASDDELSTHTAIKLARECYDSSTDWINSSRRSDWMASIRAFQGQHPSGSKYLSNEYRFRSNLYRPKTRAMVRKGESHTAAAFFSNEDVCSVQPMDDDDQMQKASSEVLQRLLQYRLSKPTSAGGIPWFLTLVGGRQDCDVMGGAVAKVYWRYSEQFHHTDKVPTLDDKTGEPDDLDQDVFEIVEDKPHVDLLPLENFRFDPGADWRDPVHTSPYLIEVIPMYHIDVRDKINSDEWNHVSESALRTSTNIEDEGTRRVRESGRVPGKSPDTRRPRDYDIVWVHLNTMRWHGKDWCYYTVGTAGELLTDPVPIEEMFLHGERPYVFGFVIPETHKSYPASKTQLIRDLQRATNDEMNLRFDALKLSLQPRQFVKQGAGIELQDLRLFAPGKTVLVSNPKEDVVWDRPPDVSQAAYEEQDRINLDFDELVGDFSNSSVQASQQEQQSATGMHLMSGIASSMAEYELHMFATTFVEPVLSLLIRLEQAYETDPVILAIAGRQAQLFQKYGISHVTDDLLNQQLTVKVNVGIGATNPQLRLKNFVAGADILSKMFGPSLIQGVNFQEVSKEVLGLLGYRDGARFFQPQFDPRVAELQQQLQQLQSKQHGAQGAQPDPFRLEAEKVKSQAEIEKAKITGQTQTSVAQTDMQTDLMKEHAETQREQLRMQHEGHLQQHQSMMDAQTQTDLEAMRHASSMQQAHVSHAHTMQQQATQQAHQSATADQQHQHTMQQQRQQAKVQPPRSAVQR